MSDSTSIYQIEMKASNHVAEEKLYPRICFDQNIVENEDELFPVCQQMQQAVDQNGFIVLNIYNSNESVSMFRASVSKIAAYFGNLMVQNDLGHTVVEVFDRDIGRIEDGVRYHQTRQGGDIHTDSVNRPEPIRYLMLACAAPATIGGESILIRAQDIYKELLAFPDILNVLEQDFYFEGRGMAQEYAIFKIPVLEMGSNRPRFRYLRSYIANAHKNVGAPLSPKQIEAFDVLDALLETSALQFRITLAKGDVLIVDDTAVFHGRTSFVDRKTEDSHIDRRHMLRYWID